MLELNNKTNQDFLDLEWCERLTRAGIDMSDAKYKIVVCGDKRYVVYNSDEGVPTYTLSELLYKLNEYPKAGTPLKFFKDAPFYGFYYPGLIDDCYSEYPIEGAAMLLLCCAKEGVHYVKDISDK